MQCSVYFIFFFSLNLTTACWWAICLYFSNSKEKTISMNVPEILFSSYSFQLHALALYSLVYYVVYIIHLKKLNVTENWNMHRIAMALLVLLLKRSNCSLHVTCFYCVSHSFIQVQKKNKKKKNKFVHCHRHAYIF